MSALVFDMSTATVWTEQTSEMSSTADNWRENPSGSRNNLYSDGDDVSSAFLRSSQKWKELREHTYERLFFFFFFAIPLCPSVSHFSFLAVFSFWGHVMIYDRVPSYLLYISLLCFASNSPTFLVEYIPSLFIYIFLERKRGKIPRSVVSTALVSFFATWRELRRLFGLRKKTHPVFL